MKISITVNAALIIASITGVFAIAQIGASANAQARLADPTFSVASNGPAIELNKSSSEVAGESMAVKAGQHPLITSDQQAATIGGIANESASLARSKQALDTP